MKVQFEKGDINYIILILVFIILSAFQYNRNSGLKEKIKSNDIIVKNLKTDKVDLLKSVEALEEIKSAEERRADSLEVKEKYYKYKFYSTNEKLKKTLATYSSADLDGKNELFTRDLSD